MKRGTFIFFLLALTACRQEPGTLFEDFQIVDLTHPFDEVTVYWPTEENFKLTREFAGITERGYYYVANRFQAAEHGGTHMDAPIHFHQGGLTMEAIPVSRLVGPGVVIDVSKPALRNPDFQIITADLLEWERSHGTIPEEALVLFKTGYSKFWPDRKKYLGTDLRGEHGVAELHFPGLAPEAAEWLLKNRKIRAVGIDTASIDYGRSELFPTHRILSKNNTPILENIADLEPLPPRDFFLIALPMKIQGGSGAPLRLIALIGK